MSNLEKRKSQSRVKHEILDRYIRRWGGIISNGLRRTHAAAREWSRPFRPRFVYVDYFAFSGIYAPEKGVPVYGSPIIGIRAVDGIREFAREKIGFESDTVTILFEEKRETYDQLVRTLRQLGYADRLRTDDNIASLQGGQIGAIRGDCTQYFEEVLRFIGRDTRTFSFHFIDPYGPKGIPFHAVSHIVSQPRTDCIINWVYEPIMRRMGLITKQVLSSAEKKHIDHLDRVFGSQSWQPIALRVANGELNQSEGEAQLTTLYEQALQEADPELTIKKIQLMFEEREQTLYYLFLTTHDPTGALAMNEILDEAEINAYDYRQEKRLTKGGYRQLDIFSVGIEDPARPAEPQVDIEAIAGLVYEQCKGRTLIFRDVLKAMVNSPFYESDVRNAMRILKDDRAEFNTSPSALTNQTPITFR